MRFQQVPIVNTACVLLILLLSGSSSIAQYNPQPSSYQLVKTNSFIQSKNYYLLTLFEELPSVKKLLMNDSVLAIISKTKKTQLQHGLKNCSRNVDCYLQGMKFSTSEIELVGSRLREIYQPGNALGKMVTNHLVPSGTYIQYAAMGNKEILIKAWEQDAQGINFCIDVYAGGSKPNYPLIDSISFRTKDPRANDAVASSYLNLLYSATFLMSLESETHPSFYFSPLNFALRFLELNEREQAADFEPMAEGENRMAFERVRKTPWKDFKYSLILVPGAGPDNPDVPLSAEAMLRCRLAAVQFQKGMAPFIMVSGGKVHPYKTKYCEAEEMKKFLVEKLQISPGAILIDPHARHTTTNLRNAARIMYRYGFPFDKPAITCTTRGQSYMIEKMLAERCQKELNIIPFKIGLRLSETEVEFYPLIAALQINPKEPMDP